MLIVIENNNTLWYVPDTLDGWRYRSLIWDAVEVPGEWRWLNDEPAAWALARVGMPAMDFNTYHREFNHA